MTRLAEYACEVCRVGAPLVTHCEIQKLLQEIPDWKVVENDGVSRLERLYEFRSFAEALRFTNRVGALAEDAGHHPSLLTEWGRVTVSWWTHKLKGLHRNDFIMAAKTDAAYEDRPRSSG